MKSSVVSKPWQIDVEGHYGLDPTIARIISRCFGQEKINKFIRDAFYDAGLPTVEARCRNFLRLTDCAVETNRDFLSSVPASGPVVFLSNHPSGVFDGIVLLSLLLELRPDTKIIVNRHFRALGALSEAFIFANVDDDQQSFRDIRPVIEHLRRDGALIVFPAGEVSRFNGAGIRDRHWRPAIVNLAARREIPVVPVHIDNRASYVFHAISLLAPPLAPLALLGDVYRRRRTRARITFDKPRVIAREAVAEAASESLRREIYDSWRLAKRRRDRFEPARPAFNRFSSALHLARSVTPLEEGRFGLVFDGNLPGAFYAALGSFRHEVYGSLGFPVRGRFDVDRFDPDFRHILLWDARHDRIYGAMRMKIHEKGLGATFVSAHFSVPADHPLRQRSALEVGRFAMRPGSGKCDALWKTASAGMGGQLPDLFVGVVSLPTLPPAVESRLVDWALQSRSGVAPPVQPDAPYRAHALGAGEILPPLPAFSKEGVSQLRQFAGERGAELPVLLTAYPKVVDFKGHYEAARLDPSWGNCVDLFKWGYLADMNVLGRRIGFAPQPRAASQPAA